MLKAFAFFKLKNISVNLLLNGIVYINAKCP